MRNSPRPADGFNKRLKMVFEFYKIGLTILNLCDLLGNLADNLQTPFLAFSDVGALGRQIGSPVVVARFRLLGCSPSSQRGP